MLDLTKVPHINISVEMYFRVNNSDMWNKETGYMKMDLQNCSNVTELPDNFLDEVLSTIAKQHHIDIKDVEFITQKEYLAETEDDETTPLEFHVEDDPEKTTITLPQLNNTLSHNFLGGSIEATAYYDGITVRFRPAHSKTAIDIACVQTVDSDEQTIDAADEFPDALKISVYGDYHADLAPGKPEKSFCRKIIEMIEEVKDN